MPKPPARRPKPPPALPAGYDELLTDLKRRISEAQVRTASAVNRALVMVYWSIGCDILDRQSEAGWGEEVVGRLAIDLTEAFPGSRRGFSRRNVFYMRRSGLSGRKCRHCLHKSGGATTRCCLTPLLGTVISIRGTRRRLLNTAGRVAELQQNS
jgi:hypothetical protein